MSRTPKALIFQGGWEGHHPAAMAGFCADGLRSCGVTVEIVDSLSVLDDPDYLSRFDVISPCWTMGKLTPEQSKNLGAAIRSGVGLGGFHGGMGDAFRGDLDYEWMVGGHFVGHPYVGTYEVRRSGISHPVTEELPHSFEYDSEQYYLMMDPGVTVLAETTYRWEENAVPMPVVWIRNWGKGRVFYSALGHNPGEFDRFPFVAQMTLNGLRWAANAL